MEDVFAYIDEGNIVDPAELEANRNREELSKSTQFQKGTSGNPNGRPKGSRNKLTLVAEALLDGEAEALIRKIIEMAKGGNLAALKLCVERLIPVRRTRSVSFELPDTSTSEGVLAAHDALLAAVATGELTPEEGETIGRLLEAKQRAISATDLEERVKALEHKAEAMR